MTSPARPGIDRAALVEWYRRNRARSAALFALLDDAAYYAQPIDLRHPVVFYEGHLPAFSFNTLVKRGLGCPSIDERLEGLFARGIDPEEAERPAGASRWPDRQPVRDFAAEADRQVLDCLASGGFERPGASLLDRGEAAFTIDRHDVTNAALMEFVEVGGYRTEQWWAAEDWAWVQSSGVRHPLFWEHDGRDWYWRGMFGLLPLPQSWPVYVSQAEAAAYARWRGTRLPTEAEFQRAAFGTPAGTERRHPWCDEEPSAAHGVFDVSSWDPEPAGTHPADAVPGGRPGGQWLELDTDDLRAVPRIPRAAVISGVLGRVLRLRARRDEGRVAGDGARAVAAVFPKLVPAAVSVRVCHVPGSAVTHTVRSCGSS